MPETSIEGAHTKVVLSHRDRPRGLKEMFGNKVRVIALCLGQYVLSAYLFLDIDV